MENGFPISPDRAIFLSDAHMNKDDVHTRTFLDLAGKAASENAALFLLGDVFDLWFGAPSLTFGFQKPVVSRLQELRRSGLRVYYVEGNRDFYLKKPHEGVTFDKVAEVDMRTAVGGKRIYLSHGDMVNRGDLAYRFWKAISKNRLAYGTVSVLPSSIVLPLAERMERTLKRTNVQFRGTFPEAECREYARERFAEGIDIVILGHFHSERLLRFSPGEPEGVLAVLPSWREGWRYFHLAPNGSFGFRSFDPGSPLFP